MSERRKIILPEEVGAVMPQAVAGLTHTQQTSKQPVIMNCPNPECRDPRYPMQLFSFVSDDPVCPKCGIGTPAVQKRSLIHLIVRDKDGPLVGYMGMRYRILCDPKRELMATARNGEALTPMPQLINCPGCIKLYKRLTSRDLIEHNSVTNAIFVKGLN